VSVYNNFFAKLVVSLCVIERWFHFPPHLSSAATLPWEITELLLGIIFPFYCAVWACTCQVNVSSWQFGVAYCALLCAVCISVCSFYTLSIGCVMSCQFYNTVELKNWNWRTQKNDQFRHMQHIALRINNVLWHVWLLEASAETARHRSNTGRSPSPQGWQISVQSYPLVTRQRTQ